MYIYLFTEGISHNLSRIRNPLFFFFSGFFFFRKLEKWSLDFYHLQLKKRVIKPFASLFIMEYTYDIGCLYKELCVYFSFFNWNRGRNYRKSGINSLYMLFWHTPVNYPLWFLRDLICMSALSPLFYAFFKYLKIYGLLILLALYLSVWEQILQD